ncbi:MAG: M15 family metallopeptidase [Clostridia bacterium]|nr:M15 family metallopeptidase [Clostridia bacterium]
MKGFVLVSQAVPDVILEIRYHSTFNFVGERVDGYEQPVAILACEAADALKKASDAAMVLGYRIKVYDAFRPQRAVDHFVRWAEDAQACEMKPYFYPEVDKSRLFEEGYIARKSGHSRGSTVDVTLVDMMTGTDLDMGGAFDYFGMRSHPDYTEGLTETQFANRMLLQKLMVKSGFRPLDSEWWHFTLVDEPYPDTYFDFSLRAE